jgi:hypothetical protein
VRLLLLVRELLRRIMVSVLLLRRHVSLRGSAIALLRRIPAAIRHGCVHVRSRHWVARSGRAHSVWHCTTKVSSIAAAAASSTETTSRAVVGCLVNSNVASVKLDIVHGCDGVLSIALLGISHKPEAAAATSITVLDHHLYISIVRNGLAVQQTPALEPQDVGLEAPCLKVRRNGGTYSFFDRTKLLKLLAKSGLLCVPC